MSGGRWVQMRVEHTITCRICLEPHTYIRTNNRPRIYCRPCGRARKLKIMRDWNQNYRREEKIRLEAARA